MVIFENYIKKHYDCFHLQLHKWQEESHLISQTYGKAMNYGQNSDETIAHNGWHSNKTSIKPTAQCNFGAICCKCQAKFYAEPIVIAPTFMM